MKQREDDPAAKRAFRRMAVLLAVLIVGGIVLALIWLKEPAGTVNSPATGSAAQSSSGATGGASK
jgi:hypothetical protein